MKPSEASAVLSDIIRVITRGINFEESEGEKKREINTRNKERQMTREQ